MSNVVKFPGVEKTIYEMTPEEIEQAFNRVVPTLPQRTEEGAATRQEQLDEEFYYEDATEAINHSLTLLFDYRDIKTKEFGENSAEVTAVKEEIAPVMAKLRELENNLFDSEVRNAIKSLREIWGKYKGVYYDEEVGDYQWRSEPVGAEIIPALRGAINFNL